MNRYIINPNKALSSQFVYQNAIYVIRDNVTLNANITIPANCVLEFDGGSLSNTAGNEYTLEGQGTYIESPLLNIFGTTTYLTGSWTNEVLNPEWFGAIPYGKPDMTVVEPIYTTLVSSFNAFTALVKNALSTNIKTMKLNACYFVDDEIVIDNNYGNPINIVADSPDSGFICYINDTSKYLLDYKSYSSNLILRNFFVYCDHRTNAKGVLHFYNPIRTYFDNVRCRGGYCNLTEGIFVLEVPSGSNIFNNMMINCEGTGTLSGHGIYYKLPDVGYYPTGQILIGCKFQALGGCGIVTEIKPGISAGFGGLITQCEIEGNAKGSIFLGAINRLTISHGYWEGHILSSVNPDLPIAPISLGTTIDNNNVYGCRIENLILDNVNVGETGNQQSNAEYAIYLGQKRFDTTKPLTGIMNNVSIRNGYYTANKIPYFTLLNKGRNISIDMYDMDLSKIEFEYTADLIDLVIKNSNGEIHRTKNLIQTLPLIEGNTNVDTPNPFSIDNNGVLTWTDNSSSFPLEKGKTVTVNNRTFVSVYGGIISSNTIGDYTQGSTDITNVPVNFKWMFWEGAILVGPYWDENKATVTSVNGTTVTVNKPSLITKTAGIVTKGLAIDIKLFSAMSKKPNIDSFGVVPYAVGAMSFDTATNKPIWWNGTAWVDATGTPV